MLKERMSQTAAAEENEANTERQRRTAGESII